MAIIPLDSGNLDTFEIVGRPLQKFVSGSHHGPCSQQRLNQLNFSYFYEDCIDLIFNKDLILSQTMNEIKKDYKI